VENDIPTQPETIDAAGALAFLTERFGRDITDVERLGHGEWSTAYGYHDDGRDYVLRFGSYVDDFQRDRIAGRFASVNLPIPKVIEIGQVPGWHYAISERASGEFIDSLDETRMRELLPSLFAAFDAMREADLSGTAGYGGWDENEHAPFASWKDALLDVNIDHPGRVGGWRKLLDESAVGGARFDEAYAALIELAEYAPADRHLIHSDLLNFNALVSGNRMSALFDWGCSLYGDFLYDIAWFNFWKPWFPAWAGIDFVAEAKRHYDAIGLDVPDFDERMRACEIQIGLSNLAYVAWKGRWEQAEAVSELLAALARGTAVS
jgi:hygromycin-B 4-O-kinase